MQLMSRHFISCPLSSPPLKKPIEREEKAGKMLIAHYFPPLDTFFRAR